MEGDNPPDKVLSKGTDVVHGNQQGTGCRCGWGRREAERIFKWCSGTSQHKEQQSWKPKAASAHSYYSTVPAAVTAEPGKGCGGGCFLSLSFVFFLLLFLCFILSSFFFLICNRESRVLSGCWTSISFVSTFISFTFKEPKDCQEQVRLLLAKAAKFKSRVTSQEQLLLPSMMHTI